MRAIVTTGSQLIIAALQGMPERARVPVAGGG